MNDKPNGITTDIADEGKRILKKPDFPPFRLRSTTEGKEGKIDFAQRPKEKMVNSTSLNDRRKRERNDGDSWLLLLFTGVFTAHDFFVFL